jgi:protein-L-isoaspartate(D-aspartate) O-methyltransferase
MISAAAADHLSEDWLRQLQIGGRLVAPVKSATSDAQSLHVVDRVAEEDWSLTVLDSVRFVPLRTGTSR